MMQFRKKGGSTVGAGTYWNFETGEKFRMGQGGILPGKSSQAFYKLPPLLILAMAAAAAHVFLYVLPAYLVQFYEAYTAELVTAYVIFDYIAIGVVLSGLVVAALGDIFGLKLKVPAFSWSPAEAHLDGKHHEKTSKAKDTPRDKGNADSEKQ